MNHYFVVALGGGLGAMLRFAASGALLHAAPAMSFPLPTFVVNVLGCFCAGLLLAASDRLGGIDESLRHLLMTGILGGFTTFSAFGVETVDLIKRDMPIIAAAYSLGSVVAGVLALCLATVLVGRS